MNYLEEIKSINSQIDRLKEKREHLKKSLVSECEFRINDVVEIIERLVFINSNFLYEIKEVRKRKGKIKYIYLDDDGHLVYNVKPNGCINEIFIHDDGFSLTSIKKLNT